MGDSHGNKWSMECVDLSWLGRNPHLHVCLDFSPGVIHQWGIPQGNKWISPREKSTFAWNMWISPEGGNPHLHLCLDFSPGEIHQWGGFPWE